MNISFQAATLADVELLLPLLQEFYQHEDLAFDEPKAQHALRGIIENDRFGFVFLIFADGALAGYTALTFGYSLEFHGRDAFVDELFIAAPFRGQGIGKQALTFLAGVCRQQGIAALHLEVERKNSAAQRVYHDFGFADHDRYLLTKWLASEPAAS